MQKKLSLGSAKWTVVGQRKLTAKLCKINRPVREYHQQKKLNKKVCKKYLLRNCRKPEQTKIENSRFLNENLEVCIILTFPI